MFMCVLILLLLVPMFSDIGNNGFISVANVSDTKNNNYFLASENLE